MGVKGEDLGDVLGSMTEVWPEIEGDNGWSSNGRSWGALPSAGTSFSSSLLSSQEALGMCLYLAVTLKIFNNCYAQMQTSQNRGLLHAGAGVLQTHAFGILGKLGAAGGEECLEEGSGHKAQKMSTVRQVGWAVRTVGVYKFGLIFQNLIKILTTRSAIPGDSRLF